MFANKQPQNQNQFDLEFFIVMEYAGAGEGMYGLNCKLMYIVYIRQSGEL